MDASQSGSAADGATGGQTLLYVVGMTPEAGFDELFNTWYDGEHVPELLACPGFLSARRFRSIEGTPQYLAIYELQAMTAFSSPEYLRMRSRAEGESNLAKTVRAHRTRDLKAVYEQLSVVRRGCA